MNSLNVVSSLLAFTVGLFFVLARFRFFYDPSKPRGERFLNRERHASLTHKMEWCGFKRMPYALAWWVAFWEVAAGLMLMFNIMRPFAAAVILVVLVMATKCTAYTKVMEQNPVDYIDVVCSYLWRVEGLYIVMTLGVLAADLL